MKKEFDDFSEKVKMIHATYRTLIRKVTDEHDITVPHYKLLCGIASDEGLSQVELAKDVHMQTPTVSLLLKQMEEMELVFRRPDKYDLRKTHVYTSEKGKALFLVLNRESLKIEASIMKGTSPEDAEAFYRVLDNMERNAKLLVK